MEAAATALTDQGLAPLTLPLRAKQSAPRTLESLSPLTRGFADRLCLPPLFPDAVVTEFAAVDFGCEAAHQRHWAIRSQRRTSICEDGRHVDDKYREAATSASYWAPG